MPHTFVIGEMAGTHGVKRPGGSALNAGQVGASRTAEFITHVYGSGEPDVAAAKAIAKKALAEDGWEKLLLAKRSTAKVTAAEIMAEIGERMTRYGAHLRSRDGATKALAAAKAQYAALLADGVKFSKMADLPQAVIAVQQCLTQVALLKAICAMFERGAGSRGSHCILDPQGIEMHPKLIDADTGKPYRFKPENESLRNEIVQLAFDPKAADLFAVKIVTPRPMPDRNIAFEPAWTEFREGMIYKV